MTEDPYAWGLWCGYALCLSKWEITMVDERYADFEFRRRLNGGQLWPWLLTPPTEADVVDPGPGDWMTRLTAENVRRGA
jgi:hypothetical protein